MGECKASARAGDTENCGASGEGGGVGGWSNEGNK